MTKYFIAFLFMIASPVADVAAQGFEWNQSPNLALASSKSSLKIPNAFTPNGDGLNDVFKVINLTNERIVDFRVFNRWGTIVYRSIDSDGNAGWDGNYKGQAQPTGVYGYLIRIAYPDGNIETYKGTVTLIR
jgi:gliding motility-associated-like protein